LLLLVLLRLLLVPTPVAAAAAAAAAAAGPHLQAANRLRLLLLRPLLPLPKCLYFAAPL